MLQKIVFQDNIFQLSRSIDTVYEGMLLDLSADYFFDKTVDDILFFDASIQKLFRQMQTNQQLSDYVAILHSLYSCQSRFMQLISLILQGKTSMRDSFAPLLAKLQGIRNVQANLQHELAKSIQKSDKTGDSRDIVSQNELSELLNF